MALWPVQAWKLALLMATVTLMMPLCTGNGAGDVFRHGVHHSAVVCRLSQQVHVVTRSSSIRAETYFRHRSAAAIIIRTVVIGFVISARGVIVTLRFVFRAAALFCRRRWSPIELH